MPLTGIKARQAVGEYTLPLLWPLMLMEVILTEIWEAGRNTVKISKNH